MKRRNPHLVFLSRQTLDIFIALKTFAGDSEYVLPSRYDSDTPMSSATLNQVLMLTYRLAQKEGKPLAKSDEYAHRRENHKKQNRIATVSRKVRKRIESVQGNGI